MNEYRIDKQGLWNILEQWDKYIPGKIRLVACGGTALTLQDLKESTKDVDFLVPEENEYRILIQAIKRLGYRQSAGSGWARDDGFKFDLFAGKKVFTTELLESPLEEKNHILIRALRKLYVATLNDYDLAISKLFRGDGADIQDCLILVQARGKKFDLEEFKARYRETAKYEINEKRMLNNLEGFLSSLFEKK